LLLHSDLILFTPTGDEWGVPKTKSRPAPTMALIAAAGSPSSLKKPFHWATILLAWSLQGLLFTLPTIATFDTTCYQDLRSRERYTPTATPGHSSDDRHKIAILYLYFHDPFLSSEIDFTIKIIESGGDLDHPSPLASLTKCHF
jgi:hypothetical protein